ncbi:HD domain-containing protein [bacterium]|nr:HD domain-containing protein [bacterium]
MILFSKKNACFLIVSFLISIQNVSARQHITLVRDYHCHYETQRKISEFIGQNLSDSHSVVFVEGAHGKIDLNAFTRYPDKKAVEYVSDYFLKKGLISGSEYFSIHNDSAEILVGIDDRDYYLKSTQIFRDIIAHEAQIKTYIQFVQNEIVRLKEQYFSDALWKVDRLRTAYHNDGSMGLFEYLAALKEEYIRFGKFQTFTIINRCFELRESLEDIPETDFQQTKKQFMEYCKTAVSGEAYENLNTISMKHMLGAVSDQEFWFFLKNFIEQNNLSVQPFAVFFQKLSMQDELLKMVKEIDRELFELEWELYHKLGTTFPEQKLTELIFYTEFSQKLCSFTIPGYLIDIFKEKLYDFDYDGAYRIMSRDENCAKITDVLSQIAFFTGRALRFYALSAKRDESMLFCIDSFFEEHPSVTNGIVVCGAMHISLLEKELKEHGYRVSVVYPEPSGPLDNTVYIERMTGEPVEWSDFMPEPGFLAFASLFASKPFLEQLPLTDTHLPIFRRVRIALLTTSLRMLIESQKNAGDNIHTLVQQVNALLGVSALETETELEVTNIYVIKENQLAGFDARVVSNGTAQHIRVNLTADIDLLDDEDFILIPYLQRHTSMRREFHAALTGNKSKFDSVILPAKNAVEAKGRIVFGDTFVRLKDVDPQLLKSVSWTVKPNGSPFDLSPYSMAIHVANNLNINGIDPKYHRVLRLAALTQDIWKVYASFDDFQIIKEDNKVRITFAASEQVNGETITERKTVAGTPGELSAGLVPLVLSEMRLTLPVWELQLLQKLLTTYTAFGVIGQDWNEESARQTFRTAAEELDIKLESYVQLARRIYEADIVSIYTELRMAGKVDEQVAALLDISEREQRVLGAFTPEVLPVEGGEKIKFFESLVSSGPEFMRMITRAMDDDAYAAQIFPPTMLRLREISHENTSAIHRHPETGLAINPFLHTLNVVNQLNIEGLNNVRAIRIAAMFHDLGKLQFVSYTDKGYKYHAEESGKMVPSVLEEWGIRNQLSDAEVLLIQYLVERHDRLSRHTQPTMQWEWTLQKSTESIIPPKELQDAGFDFFTALRYVRRLQQADSDSIPKYKGSNNFDAIETLFAHNYIAQNPSLWEVLSKRYSPNLPIKSKRDPAVQFVALNALGLERGSDFVDQSRSLASAQGRVNGATPMVFNPSQSAVLESSL